MADEKTPDGASENVERRSKEKEGQRILGQIREGAFGIALAIEERCFPVKNLQERCRSWVWKEKDIWYLSSADH